MINCSKSSFLVVLLIMIGQFAQTSLQINLKPSMIVELVRHGARVGLSSPYGSDDPMVKEVGAGNLTMVGLRQHYLLGKQIRENYPELFQNSEISNFDYELHASSKTRCINSANAHLQGLYPEGTGEIIPDQFEYSLLLPDYDRTKITVHPKFQTALPHGMRQFPIQSTSPVYDFFFWPTDYQYSCPAARKNAEAIKEKANEDVKKVIQGTFDKLEEAGFNSKEYYNIPEWDPVHLLKVWDHTRAWLFHKGHHIKGMNDMLYREVELASSYFWAFGDWGDKNTQKMRLKNMLERIINGFDDRISGKNKQLKFIMFSGHDSTVFPFYLAYNFSNAECMLKKYQTFAESGTETEEDCEITPGFASSLIWELNQDVDSGKWYVRIIVDGNPKKFECKGMIKGNYCPYDQWKDLTNTLKVDSQEEFEKYCKGSGSELDEEYKLITIGLGIFCLILVVFLIALEIYIRSKTKVVDDKEDGYSYLDSVKFVSEGGKSQGFGEYKDSELENSDEDNED